MPSGKRGNRGRGRGDGGSGPNSTKATRTGGDKPTPATKDNKPASKQTTGGSSKPPALNADVHHTNEEEEMAAILCWICAEPIRYYALSACNHRTCHVCALRLRALYEKPFCTFCKEPQLKVICTASPDASFSSFTPKATPYKDVKLAISFETAVMMEETLALLRFNCPSVECDYTASGWGHLKLHTRAVHGKVFCNLCIQFKKAFAHEHALYPPDVLPSHLPSMPHRWRRPLPNEAIEGGIHPLCEFCNECFFGEDELFVHMREQHEECFLCRQNGIRYQYFQTYDSLETHFSQAHFACTNSGCQAQKFVVFNSELDLNAHRLEVHGADMSPKERREAQRVRAGSYNMGSSTRRGEDFTLQELVQGPITQIIQTQGNTPVRSREATEGILMREDRQATRHAAPNGRDGSVKPSIPGCRANESGAHELISTVWNVLDQNLQGTAKIINAVVNFLEDKDEKKHALLSAWSESENELESFDHDPTVSSYARIASGNVLSPVCVTAPQYSPQSPRPSQLDIAQPASPSASSSTFSPVLSSIVPTFASPDTSQLEAFPSLVRPRASSEVASFSEQSQKSKSWASVARLSSSPTTTKKKGTALPPASPATHGQSSLPTAGPFFDSHVASAYHYPYPNPLQPLNDWATVASTNMSAWGPSWNAGDTTIPETTAGKGTRGKGKQKQRLASGSFTF